MRETKRPTEPFARFSYEGLERVMHEKARLGIMTSLVTHPEGLLFTDLKELCGLTDGNLNRHLKVLREEGLIEIRKGTSRNRPSTLCRVTPGGRERFVEYLSVLEQIIADAATAARERNRSTKSAANSRQLSGWSPA
jgi:DNA-binding MarR family transcriptional regulator